MRIPGIEKFPDLQARFQLRLGQLAADSCGGCKLRALVETFTAMVIARQKRDNDFRKR